VLEPPPKVLSAGLVVARRYAGRFRLLCLRAFDRWDFPSTPVPGADPLAAALAATRDAIGIDDLDLHWGEDYRETIAFADGRVSRYYLAQTATAEVVLRVPPGPGSQDDYEYRWVTYDEAEEILPPRLSLVLDWALSKLSGGPAR